MTRWLSWGPVPIVTMNLHEVDEATEAVFSIDATKGNRIVNHRGFGVTPTVRQGHILPVAPDLVDVYERVSGRPAVVLLLSTFEITLYDNGLYHVNSILQLTVTTAAPVVGVATTAASAVPGTATGAKHAADVDQVVRFCLEVAKGYGAGGARLYDPDEFAQAVALYRPMTHVRGGDA